MTPSEAQTRVLDLALALERVDGDTQLLREVAQLFLEIGETMLAEVQAAVSATDAKKLEMSAHSLKGAVANLGAVEAAQCALVLERHGRTGQWQGVPQALAALESALRELTPALEQVVQG